MEIEIFKELIIKYGFHKSRFYEATWIDQVKNINNYWDLEGDLQTKGIVTNNLCQFDDKLTAKDLWKQMCPQTKAYLPN